MRIMRDDFVTLEAKPFASYEDITTATAHAFMVKAAQEEAAKVGGIVTVLGGELSGQSAARIELNGRQFATYRQEW